MTFPLSPNPYLIQSREEALRYFQERPRSQGNDFSIRFSYDFLTSSPTPTPSPEGNRSEEPNYTGAKIAGLILLFLGTIASKLLSSEESKFKNLLELDRKYEIFPSSNVQSIARIMKEIHSEKIEKVRDYASTAFLLLSGASLLVIGGFCAVPTYLPVGTALVISSLALTYFSTIQDNPSFYEPRYREILQRTESLFYK